MKNLITKLLDLLTLIWLALAILGPFWTLPVFGSRIILSDIALLLLALFTVFKLSMLKIRNWWPLMALLVYGFIIEPSFTSLLFGGRLMAILIVGLQFVDSQKSRTVKWIANHWVLLMVIIGLLQVTFLPDTRWLLAYGFDEHLGRAHGTLLDPTFYGLLSAWQVIASLFAKSSLGLALGLVGAVLSYSRLSWLALAISLIVYKFISRKNKSLSTWLIVAAFIVAILFAPKDNGGLGHNILRTNTVEMRTQEVEKRINESKGRWALGNGWSKLTLNGFDNGYIALWSATGFVGFLFVFIQVYQLLKLNILTHQDFVLIVLVAIHALGAPTFFYPWILISAVTFFGTKQPRTN